MDLQFFFRLWAQDNHELAAASAEGVIPRMPTTIAGAGRASTSRGRVHAGGTWVVPAACASKAQPRHDWAAPHVSDSWPCRSLRGCPCASLIWTSTS
jgi:hypothetical protein